MESQNPTIMSDAAEEKSIWERIDEGERDPLEIIYVAKDVKPDQLHLESIEQWGYLTGYWEIHKVNSVEEAIKLNEKSPADVIILLNSWVEEAIQVSKASPHTPISLANFGGFDQFDFSIFPPQVVVAQWAAPREGEFMEALEDALSKVSTEIIYKASLPKIELFKAISEEFLARLAEFPEERFRINPRLFEEAVAELLNRLGYQVRLTPRSGDKGRDVIAYLETPTAPMLMLVECKRYAANRLVGPDPITRLWYRLFDDHANMAMVVTTSAFQPIAKETASNRGYQRSLKDGEDFIKWVRSLKI